MVKLKNKILKNSVALILLVFLLSFVKVDASTTKGDESGGGNANASSNANNKPNNNNLSNMNGHNQSSIISNDEVFDHDNQQQYSKRSGSAPSGPSSFHDQEHDQVPTKRAQQFSPQNYVVHAKVKEILNKEYQLDPSYVNGITRDIVDEIARRALIGSFAERAMFSGRVNIVDTVIRLARSYGIVRVFKFVWPILYIPCNYIIEKGIPVPQQISNSKAELLKVISNRNGNNVVKNVLSFVGTCVAMVYIDDFLGKLYARYFLESYCHDCVTIIIADYAKKHHMQKKQSSSDDKENENEDEDELS